MGKDDIKIGGVYKLTYDQRPLRVIGFDDVELFYDSWWEHANNWGLRSHRGKSFFYRMSRRTFRKISEFIKIDPFDKDEELIYKLNLPFRICRNSELCWTNNYYANQEDFLNVIKQTGVYFNDKKIDANKIVLYPFGPKGGHKKSVIVHAMNDRFFTELELLWYAHNIQSRYINDKKEGVGLYRLGIEKKMPSFYIGSYYDSAGFLKQND